MANPNPNSSLDTSDEHLISLATSALKNIPPTDENHTVAAACKSRSGATFVGVNVDHFSGGPCAEMVVLGTAAANGVLSGDITTMVAVVRRRGKPITVINPCGRCRQVMLDYNPNVEVLVLDESHGVGDKGVVRKVRARELLPFAYVWPDGNTGQLGAEGTST